MPEAKRKGKMTVAEAGRLGGEKTSKTHGEEFYRKIGHKGGQKSPKADSTRKGVRSRVKPSRNYFWFSFF